MLYTSYFAKCRKLKDNVAPVAICRGVPQWYAGERYGKLAPSWRLVKDWKSDPRSDDYFGIKRKQYNTAVLSRLDAHQVMEDLQVLIPDKLRKKMKNPVWEDDRVHIVLLCYEKPCDFCHRHFVAEWLTENGYPCEED